MEGGEGGGSDPRGSFKGPVNGFHSAVNGVPVTSAPCGPSAQATNASDSLATPGKLRASPLLHVRPNASLHSRSLCRSLALASVVMEGEEFSGRMVVEDELSEMEVVEESLSEMEVVEEFPEIMVMVVEELSEVDEVERLSEGGGYGGEGKAL